MVVPPPPSRIAPPRGDREGNPRSCRRSPLPSSLLLPRRRQGPAGQRPVGAGGGKASSSARAVGLAQVNTQGRGVALKPGATAVRLRRRCDGRRGAVVVCAWGGGGVRLSSPPAARAAVGIGRGRLPLLRRGLAEVAARQRYARPPPLQLSWCMNRLLVAAPLVLWFGSAGRWVARAT